MESQSSEGITGDDFRRLLVIFSVWYDQREYITMLKVLYTDHFKNVARLYNSSNTIDLLQLLINSGYLDSTNISILYDTIKVTKQFGLESQVRAIIPSCPKIRGVEISNFTSHRQRIMKLGMVLKGKDVTKISGLINTTLKEYADSWSLIMDLQHRMLIREEEMKNFIEVLDCLEINQAVEALTEDVDIEEEIPIEILARGPEAVKAFNEALLETETEVNQATAIFLGLGGVGKTSTIKSFLKLPFEPNEDITDAIVKIPIVCPQKQSDELHWKEAAHDYSGVTGIYEGKMVDAIEKRLTEKESKEKVPVAAEQVANNAKLLSPDIVDKAETSTEDIHGQSSSECSGSVETEPERKKRRKNTQRQPIDAVPENIKFKGETTSEWQKSDKGFIMNIWDFGGQPIYHVIQRVKSF